MHASYETLKVKAESFPWITCLLAVIYTLVVWLVNGWATLSPQALDLYGLGLSNITIQSVLSHSFLHYGVGHWAFSIFILLLISLSVEGRLGSWRFALLYFLGVSASSGLHLLIAGLMGSSFSALGPSGGIFAVLGAALFAFPHAKVEYEYLIGRFWTAEWFEFQVPLWLVLPLYALIDFLTTVSYVSAFHPETLSRFGAMAAGLVLSAFLKVPRDSKEASEAQAVLYDVDDLRLLSKSELSSLGESQPGNAYVTLALLDKLVRDQQRPNPDLQARFNSQIMLIVEDEELTRSAGSIVAVMKDESGLEPRQALRLALEVEEKGPPTLAASLFRWILDSQEMAEEEKQTAAFRLALVLEQDLGDSAGAKTLLQWLVDTYPMGSMSDSARAKLTQM